MANAKEIWQVGLAEADITPQESIRMGGYGGRNEPSKGVLDPLRAKALVLDWPGGDRGVLITTDLIGVDAPFAEAVCEDIASRTGILRRQIIINSSHTHAGPLLGYSYPRSYGLDPDEPGPIANYNAMLRERLVGLVDEALSHMAPATLSWATGSCSLGMNRRKPTPQGIKNAPHPRGYVDRSVPVLRIADPSGRLRGVMFSYACHNTTLGGQNLMISSNYAGFAQRYVEAHYPGVHSMFLMGCGADANPFPRGTYTLARMHGEGLGAEVCRLLEEDWTEFQPISGPIRAAFDHVDMPLEPRPTPERLQMMQQQGGFETRKAERMQQMIDEGQPWPTHYNTAAAVWQFGTDMTLVRLSGEVVSDYVHLVGKAIGPLGLWVAGYCSDYFGYLPSARVHEEGGYEAREFITGFGYLAASVEEAIIGKVVELAGQAGRDLPRAT